MRHDPGSACRDLQALQPAGTVHLINAPRTGLDKDFDTPIVQVRSTLFNRRAARSQARRDLDAAGRMWHVAGLLPRSTEGSQAQDGGKRI
jgi:hypothetical protein